jgi:hypothetical protein
MPIVEVIPNLVRVSVGALVAAGCLSIVLVPFIDAKLVRITKNVATVLVIVGLVGAYLIPVIRGLSLDRHEEVEQLHAEAIPEEVVLDGVVYVDTGLVAGVFQRDILTALDRTIKLTGIRVLFTLRPEVDIHDPGWTMATGRYRIWVESTQLDKFYSVFRHELENLDPPEESPYEHFSA